MQRKPKNILAYLTPPIVWEGVRRLVGHQIRYTGDFKSWADAENASTGYSAQVILDRAIQATQRVKAGEAVFERDSVLFSEAQQSFPVLAGLLRAAGESGNQLSVLDFGGSLGSSYLQCRDFLSVLPSLKWGVVEQEHFVNYGQGFLQTEQLRFFITIADCMRQIRPNVALLSSVLQYLPEPYNVLDELVSSRIPYIVVDRTPFSDHKGDRITIQHVPPSIYEAILPCRVFDKKKFLDTFLGRYEVIALFDGSDGTAVANGLGFTFGGMILRQV